MNDFFDGEDFDDDEFTDDDFDLFVMPRRRIHRTRNMIWIGRHRLSWRHERGNSRRGRGETTP